MIIGFSIKPQSGLMNFFYHFRIFYSDILDLLTNLNDRIDRNFLSLVKSLNKNFLGKISFTRFRSQEIELLAETLGDFNLINNFSLKKAVVLFLYHKTLKTNKTVASLPKPLSRYSSILTANSYILLSPKSF